MGEGEGVEGDFCSHMEEVSRWVRACDSLYLHLALPCRPPILGAVCAKE